MKNRFINKDCRNVNLPSDCLIISDPPYNIGYKYLEFNDKMDNSEYIDMFKKFKGMKCVFIHYPEDTIRFIIPALGSPTKCVSWVYNSNTTREHRMISWYNCLPDFSKVKQPYKNQTDKRVLKRMLEGSEGTNLYDWWEIDLVKNVSKEKTEYTNQIPEEVISRIIKTTATNEIIVDPFSGSGTTCCVAQKLGFDWLGLDVSQKAIEISEKRMKPLTNNLFT